MTWNNVTLLQWKQLESIHREDFEDEILYTAEIIKLFFNVDNPMDLTPQAFQKYVEDLKFMTSPIPETKLCNVYTINGTKYNFRGNIFEISMGQLMDVRNFSTKTPVDYAEVLSVFLIPDGHKYGDGYDMDKTLSDIETLPITDVLKLYNFFLASLLLSTDILTDYFNKELKKTNLTTQEKETIRHKMKEFKEVTDLIFSRTPSATAK